MKVTTRSAHLGVKCPPTPCSPWKCIVGCEDGTFWKRRRKKNVLFVGSLNQKRKRKNVSWVYTVLHIAVITDSLFKIRKEKVF